MTLSDILIDLKKLKAYLRYVERNLCAHEELERAGYNWTVCSACGRQWADDRGGKPEVDPEMLEAEKADDALHNLEKNLNNLVLSLIRLPTNETDEELVEKIVREKEKVEKIVREYKK